MRWMAENSMQNDRACAQAGAGCFARSFGDILVVDTMVMVSIFVILLGGLPCWPRELFWRACCSSWSWATGKKAFQTNHRVP